MIYRLILIFIRLMSFIPFPVGQFMGKMLGTAAALIPVSRSSTSLENIRRSFKGCMDDYGMRRLNRRVILHFGQMIFEVPHILRLTERNLHRYVEFVNEENYIEALKKGKGVFILTGHFGNWELMSAAMSIRFGPGAVVVRPVDFRPLDRLMNELRTRFGTEIIPKQKGMRRIMSAIKADKTVGILMDQNVDWYEGVFVNFLGQWACTNKGLALITLKTGTPVIPVFPVRRRDGRYSIIIEEEVRLLRKGDKVRDIEDNTALFTGVIEKYIRKYPDQWFWFHNRWKTRPYCRLPGKY